MAMMNDEDRARLESEVQSLCERGDFDGAATRAIRGIGGEIFSFLLGVHRDETAADDAFSAFSEGLWKSLPTFNWSATLRTWAYAIARNVSCMQRRGALRRDRRVGLASSSVLDEVAAPVRTETLAYFRTEKRTRLDELRQKLSPEDRELLILRVDRGLAWNDLARVLAEDDQRLDEVDVAREAARLRKRFQVLKERLREMARRAGLKT